MTFREGAESMTLQLEMAQLKGLNLKTMYFSIQYTILITNRGKGIVGVQEAVLSIIIIPLLLKREIPGTLNN